jgi:hypothetical protein
MSLRPFAVLVAAAKKAASYKFFSILTEGNAFLREICFNANGLNFLHNVNVNFLSCQFFSGVAVIFYIRLQTSVCRLAQSV